jgi:hypothetical protein
MDRRHRFAEFLEAKAVELSETIEYVGYCMAKIHGKKPYSLMHRVEGECVLFVLGFQKDGENYIARFAVKAGWNGRTIMRTCGEAVQALHSLFRTTARKAAR